MFFKNKPAPGVSTDVEGIPTATVNNHNEAFFYWMKSNLRNATLFHVDAHPDTGAATYVRRITSAYDYDQLNTANFICPAVNLGIISSIYWLNPHSIKKWIQELGVTEKYEKPLQADCFEHKNFFSEKKFDYFWSKRFYKELDNGTAIRAKDIAIPPETPLILDIDLDAFCCHQNRTLRNLPGKLCHHDTSKYDGVSDFRGRIDETISVLAMLPRPDLITIAKSLGDGKDECYVPPDKVEEVSRYLNFSLQVLFSSSYKNLK